MSTKKLVTGAMLLGAALLLAGCGHWGHGGSRDHGEFTATTTVTVMSMPRPTVRAMK